MLRVCTCTGVGGGQAGKTTEWGRNEGRKISQLPFLHLFTDSIMMIEPIFLKIVYVWGKT